MHCCPIGIYETTLEETKVEMVSMETQLPLVSHGWTLRNDPAVLGSARERGVQWFGLLIGAKNVEGESRWRYICKHLSFE